MYESKRWYCRKAVHLLRWCPWISKTGCYESPCIVTGDAVMHDRIQAQRKDLKVSNDRNIGTWKAGNMETVASLWSGEWEYPREKAITILYSSESSDMVPVKPRISKRWRDGHKSNSVKKNKTQQTQLRVWQRKSKPKGEDACVGFEAARKEK